MSSIQELFSRADSKSAARLSFRIHGFSIVLVSELCKKIDCLLKDNFHYGNPRSHSLKFFSHYPDTGLKKWLEKATKKQLAAYNDACRIENSVLARVAHACGWLLSKDSLTDYVPLTLYTELESDVTHVMSQYGSYLTYLSLIISRPSQFSD